VPWVVEWEKQPRCDVMRSENITAGYNIGWNSGVLLGLVLE